LEPGSREHPEEGYRSRFSHEDEIAQPGYYSVALKDTGIRAELTATERSGLHRYTFTKGGPAHLIVDLKHASGKDAKINWAELRVTEKDAITGGRSVAGWANGRQIYFVLHVSKPLSKVELYSDGKNVEGDAREVKGTDLKCVLHFDAAGGEAVHAKTGLSGVGIAGARRNLETEVPGWNFDEVRKAARARWNDELSRIQVETREEGQRTIFYTALYHTMLAPTLFDDVDGRYRGWTARFTGCLRGGTTTARSHYGTRTGQHIPFTR
jgi:putative alpha-1,2-mannosidase